MLLRKELRKPEEKLLLNNFSGGPESSKGGNIQKRPVLFCNQVFFVL